MVEGFDAKVAGLGLAEQQSHGLLNQIVDNQAYMLATNDIFWLCGVLFVILIPLVWTTRPPFGQMGAAH